MYSLPNAKINIGLNIVGRRPNGYHNLQTVFYPIPLTDSLEIEKADRIDAPYDFTMSGIKIDGDVKNNLIVKVFMSLRDEFDLPPTSINLGKHIPMGAGLGGGSADAAFMMKMLNEYYNLNLSTEEMERRMSKFGADCPFFIRNKQVYAEGIGDEFSPINLSLEGKYIVLVKPDIHVSTVEAYSMVKPEMPDVDLKTIIETIPLQDWRKIVKNDFEKSVFAIYPTIGAIKETLYDMGAVYASMSGSGSAVYGIFDRPIDNAKAIFPDCFTMANQF